MWLLLLLQLLCASLTLVNLAALFWLVREYIKLRNKIQRLACAARMDNLIDQLLEDDAKAADAAARQEEPAHISATQREKLATLVAGGQAKQYLGKNWTLEEIDSLSEDEVGKLYTRYEARLGASMTKTLGRTVLQLYTVVASMALPIPPENRESLMADLESDPFLSTVNLEIDARLEMMMMENTTEKSPENSPENMPENRLGSAPGLRVTAPPSQKDPKKAAAGRAGAAARKAREERLLEELRKAKEALRQEPPPEAAVSPKVEVAVSPKAEGAVSPKAEVSTPWIIGAVAAAGVGLAYLSARGAPPPPKKAAKGPIQQLEVKPNPHYME
ncbi:hypothetical protein ElyMa_005539900 [Elysia marginata]|uniref:Uncharacterized protein n=1 Tax=Elysia marginata TaxID=1093978 RepID=A0AAV4EYZ3_9GAST|nr:hypothetical protein ElyMa_005539900 [Elysia marginata]